MHIHQTPWTDFEIETLCTSWSSGLTAGQIVAKLPRRSRSSIMGKVFRMGLEKRGSPIIRPPEPEKPEPTNMMVKNARNVRLPSRQHQQFLADSAYISALCREAGNPA